MTGLGVPALPLGVSALGGDRCSACSSSSSTAHLFPVKATQSVNIAEPATFSARVLKKKETDVMWKRNGKWPQKQAWGWGCSQLVSGTSPGGMGGPQVTFCSLAGTYYQTTDRSEVRGDLVTLTLPNVSVSENGVYSATFMGDSPLWSAFYRLIVRGERGPGSLGHGDRWPYPALQPGATLRPLRSLRSLPCEEMGTGLREGLS